MALGGWGDSSPRKPLYERLMVPLVVVSGVILLLQWIVADWPGLAQSHADG
jgi:hypothetical protein